LADQPGIGRPGRVPDTREWVMPHTPYIIAYRVEDETVVILRVLHGARKWPERFHKAGEKKKDPRKKSKR